MLVTFKSSNNLDNSFSYRSWKIKSPPRFRHFVWDIGVIDFNIAYIVLILRAFSKNNYTVIDQSDCRDSFNHLIVHYVNES